MKNFFTLLLFAITVFCSHAQSCYPIDTSFGIGGKAIGINNVSNWPNPCNLIVQPDNKIIQFSSNPSNQFVVNRYKADGRPDSSFGQYGKIAITGGMASFGTLQSDGKIVIAGFTYLNNGNHRKIVLLRLNSNGSVDNSFGGTGLVTTSISSNHDEASGVAIQHDGKIVAVGYSSSSCSNDCNTWLYCKPYFTVLRYKNNGTLDSSFGQNGILAIGVGSSNTGKATSVVVQPDGKIVVAGESHTYYCDDYYGGGTYSSGLFIARFNYDGSPDVSFGQSGQVRDTVSMMTSSAFTLQPDGKFLAAGYNYSLNSFTIRRYNSNGSIDTGFYQNALLNDPYINSIAVMPDGKIVFGGRKSNGLRDFMIVRLKNDGKFDSTFNLNGKLTVHVGSTPNSEDAVTAIAAQGNRIIAGGYSFYYNSNNYSFAVLAVRLADTLTGIALPISPAGPVYPCPGFSATLTANVPGSYQWYKDGVLINGATNHVYNASSSGYYSTRISIAGGCGHSEPVLVSVGGLPVYITPSGSTNICMGDSVKLSSSEPGSLQWYFNDYPITNATDSIFWAKVQGNYYVKVNGTSGCGTSITVFVNVSPNKPPISWNGTILSTLQGYTGYQWYLNGNAIPGATGTTLTPVITGPYKVVVSSFGCNPDSDEFNLNCTVVSVPKPIISWTGSQLTSSTGYIGYQWFLDNNPITNGTANTITPQQTGIYKIEVRGPLNCSNISNDFALSCNEVGPSKPPIAWDGVKFSTSAGFSSYQWYYYDTAINGANATIYTPPAAQFGKYKVQVYNSYNCSRFSDEKLNALTAIGSIGQDKFTYYPNPINTFFYIDVQLLSKTMTAVLYDINGRLLMRKLLIHGQNRIPFISYPAGVYHMEIWSGAEKTILKLAVIK